MSTGCENCGDEIAYGYLRAGQVEVIKDIERLVCSMMNTYADEKGVRAPCGDLKGNRYGNTAKHIARALILEFDQIAGKTGEVQEVVGKVGSQDFTIDWQYSGRGGAVKATNCTDPVAAVERAIPELRKFAKSCVGEVTGEAVERISGGDAMNDISNGVETGEAVGEMNRAKMAGIPEGYTEDDVERLIQFRQEEQSYHPDSQCTAYIKYVNALIREKKTGEVVENTDEYVCSNCGAPVQNGADYCEKCQKKLDWREIQAHHQDGNAVGEVVDEPFTCENCDQPVYIGDQCCSKCGKPLNWKGINDVGSGLDD